MTAIKEIHYESHGTYGSPRITRDLEKINIQCSRQRVARLMRVMGIRAKCARKFKVTTDSNHKEPIAPNLLGQKTSLPICRSRSGQVISPTLWTEWWVAVFNGNHWSLFNREIIGYSLSKESLDRTNSQTPLWIWRYGIGSHQRESLCIQTEGCSMPANHSGQSYQNTI